MMVSGLPFQGGIMRMSGAGERGKRGNKRQGRRNGQETIAEKHRRRRRVTCKGRARGGKAEEKKEGKKKIMSIDPFRGGRPERDISKENDPTIGTNPLDSLLPRQLHPPMPFWLSAVLVRDGGGTCKIDDDDCLPWKDGAGYRLHLLC
jgi:hypothetical protein